MEVPLPLCFKKLTSSFLFCYVLFFCFVTLFSVSIKVRFTSLLRLS